VNMLVFLAVHITPVRKLLNQYKIGRLAKRMMRSHRGFRHAYPVA
jgi:hypothetical protein